MNSLNVLKRRGYLLLYVLRNVNCLASSLSECTLSLLHAVGQKRQKTKEDKKKTINDKMLYITVLNVA